MLLFLFPLLALAQNPVQKKKANRETYRHYQTGEKMVVETENDMFVDDQSHADQVWQHHRKVKRRKFSERDNSNTDRWESDREWEEKESKSVESSGSEGYGNILAGIGIVILLAIAAFVAYKLISNRNPDASKRVRSHGFTEDQNPEEIPKTELELALEDAIKSGNYRTAIRVYFVFILKDLAEKKWISWKKDKTNMAYLSEMHDRDEYNGFNASVLLYEVIWFGKLSITQEEFQRAEPVFKELIHKLNIR